jgi:hypothetical protein
MTDPVVIQWDTTKIPAEVRALLPEGLRGLPPGRYVVEPLVDDEELTPEEEAGLLPAMAELDAGQGVRWDEVLADLRDRTAAPAPTAGAAGTSAG